MGSDSNRRSNENTKEPMSRGGSVLLVAFVVFLSALGGLAGWLYVTDNPVDTPQSYSNSATLSSPVIIEKKIPEQPQLPPASPQPSAHISKKTEPSTEATANKPPPAETAMPTKDVARDEAEDETQQTVKTDAQAPALTAQKHDNEHVAVVPAEKTQQDPASPTHEAAAETDVKPAPKPIPEAPLNTEVKESGAEVKESGPKPSPELTSETTDIAAVKKPQTHAADTAPAKAKAQLSMTFSLPPAPDPALIVKGSYGLLPVVGPAGQLPWRVYSRPFDDPLDRPQIALIMSDMGMSDAATRSVIQRLPGTVTMSFNPYAKSLQNWIDLSRAAGHEVILQLPMEPYGYPENDPGPHTLLTSLSIRENLNRLEWLLSRFAGYTGVTSQMGSKFIASDKDIEPVLAVIKKSGLLFVDTRSSRKSVSARIAKKLGLPVAINNRYLDNSASRNAIDARLGELEKIARVTGAAVGIGYPYPVTIERIVAWSESLARKGIVLVPVSEIVNKQDLQ